MMIDLGGGGICPGCGELYDFVPLDGAQLLGGVPHGSRLVPAAEVPAAQWKPLEPFWTGAGWPHECPRCDAQGYVVPLTAGASFFRV